MNINQLHNRLVKRAGYNSNALKNIFKDFLGYVKNNKKDFEITQDITGGYNSKLNLMHPSYGLKHKKYPLDSLTAFTHKPTSVLGFDDDLNRMNRIMSKGKSLNVPPNKELVNLYKKFLSTKSGNKAINNIYKNLVNKEKITLEKPSLREMLEEYAEEAGINIFSKKNEKIINDYANKFKHKWNEIPIEDLENLEETTLKALKAVK